MKINKKKILFFQKELTIWYNENSRKFPWRNKSASNYTRIIAEFLLKRTTAKSASEIITVLIKKYPSWKKLSKASFNDLKKTIKPIGLYNQRAKDLKSLSKIISDNRGRFPQNKSDLLKLPGVGNYVANSILLFCYNQKVPLIDSNFIRVIKRFFDLDIQDYPKIDKKIEKIGSILLNVEDPIKMNWSIFDFSAKVCHYQYPKCIQCVISKKCLYYITMRRILNERK
jgi:A/G-specific adenine glycosylase